MTSSVAAHSVWHPDQGMVSDVRPATAVTRLTLNEFRSYQWLRVETDGRPVVLTGANGAGKTNLLEALSFLAPGRGLRGAKVELVARRPVGSTPAHPQAWAVAATVATPDGPVEVGTGGDPAKPHRRIVRMNGRPERGAAALGRALGVIWLTPAMDRLFVDSPAGRRRFLDRLVVTLDPDHAGRTAAYDRAMRQRAYLLRDGSGIDAAWCAALEDIMVRYGVAVAAARRDMVNRLNAALAAAGGPFPVAHLALVGAVDHWLEEMPAIEAEDAFRRALAAERGLTAGDATAAGPHRSDVLAAMVAPGHPSHGQAAALCSTGEQKALLIAILLAAARLQRAKRGHSPLLLLDEVAAHLDADRRAALFAAVLDLGAQAWMTGTDAGVFAGLGNRAQFFTVSDAQVTRATVH